jgi:hypothetical protein
MRCVGRSTYGWMDGWIDGCMHGLMGDQMKIWMG